MKITKKELIKVSSILLLAIGYTLVNEPLKKSILSSLPDVNPLVIGIVVIAVGLYLFEIK
tara:strand:- start:615 stop:794 length:180 start_codon:yes stop_codon:yes gene_type:complete